MSSTFKVDFWIILAIVFFGFLGLSMPYLIFPSLFFNPEYTIVPSSWSVAERGLFLGVTLSAYPFGQFIGAPILGSLSDDVGRQRTLATSLFIAALCSFLTALSLKWEILWLLIASRFFAGMMEGNLAIARAMAADIKEISKHETFGKINAVTSIAYVLGPLLGGVLSDKEIYKELSVAMPFWMTGILFIALGFLTLKALPERKRSTAAPRRSFFARINFVKRLSLLFKNKQLKVLLLISTLYTLAVDMFFEFGPVYLTAVWLLGPGQLAIYNGALSFALSLGSAFIAGRIALLFPKKAGISASLALFGCIILGMIATDLPWVMLLLFTLSGFAIAVASTNLTVQISDAASEDNQGEVMGVQTSLRVLGDGLICLLGGGLLALSPASVMVCTAIISFAAWVYFLAQSRR